jgi:hypothetical protein
LDSDLFFACKETPLGKCEQELSIEKFLRGKNVFQINIKDFFADSKMFVPKTPSVYDSPGLKSEQGTKLSMSKFSVASRRDSGQLS